MIDEDEIYRKVERALRSSDDIEAEMCRLLSKSYPTLMDRMIRIEAGRKIMEIHRLESDIRSYGSRCRHIDELKRMTGCS